MHEEACRGECCGFGVLMDFVYYHACITNLAKIDPDSRPACDAF